MPTEADDRPRAGSGRRARRTRSFALISALVVIAFATSLLATFPAAVAARYVTAPIEINAYSGTVWNGRASFAGGHAIRWQVDGWASLLALGPRLDLTVTGPGTRLAGRVALRGALLRRLDLADVSGEVAWPLVAALAPDLGFACQASATLTSVVLELAPAAYAGQGRLRAGPGTCTEPGGTDPVPVPELSGTLATAADGLHLVVTTTDNPDDPLAEIALMNTDALAVTLHPAGAVLVPGLPSSGEITLEYPLPW